MEVILGSMSRQVCVPVSEQSAAAAARRAGGELARAQGLDETTSGRLANVIMEAGTNIVKYGRDGEILLRPLAWGNARGVEVIAIDRGPGMADLGASMHNGTSSSGTYGLGLGAMQRMADEFDIYSAPDRGTVVWMTVWSDKAAASAQPWQLGVVCQPMPGETVPGDSWCACLEGSVAGVLVADGLGHGLAAASASEAAAEVLASHPQNSPGNLLEDMHAALHGTRGAAVAVTQIDATIEQASFAGIGNIAGCIIEQHDGPRRQLVSHNGIVGSNVRKVQEFQQPWPDGATLLLHSDGLGTRWLLEQYQGLAVCHPAVIAAMLYRDFSRRRDDVTVLVLRANRGH